MKNFFKLLVLLVSITDSIAGPVINCDVGNGNNDELPQGGKVQLVFGNGILTTEKQAQDAAAETLKRLKANLPPEEQSQLIEEAKTAYSQRNGLMLDFYETMREKIGADFSATYFWRVIAELEPLPDVWQEEANNLAVAFNTSGAVGAEDISEHIKFDRSVIADDNVVLRDAHSQGNFRANVAYEVLTQGDSPIPPQSFGVVSVANPASYVAGDGPYATLFEDIVIEAINLAVIAGIAPPLPANITNIGDGISSGDPIRNHNYLRAYFVEGSRSEAKIIVDLIAMKRMLAPPPLPSGEEVFSILVDRFGSTGGSDLYVFEPNGIVVSHNNPTGATGVLVRSEEENTDLYTALCSGINAGRYSIGLDVPGNSFDVTGVKVSSGDSYLSFTYNVASTFGDEVNVYFDVIATEIEPNVYDLDLEFFRTPGFVTGNWGSSQ